MTTKRKKKDTHTTEASYDCLHWQNVFEQLIGNEGELDQERRAAHKRARMRNDARKNRSTPTSSNLANEGNVRQEAHADAVNQHQRPFSRQPQTLGRGVVFEAITRSVRGVRRGRQSSRGVAVLLRVDVRSRADAAKTLTPALGVARGLRLR